ncbi:hypothetical protein [Streptomyces sp. SID8499]|uniref:hypothetical protein n=1 Tax=Streptomyces sp. SID8499 TaxID=2706106 RepID=UPI0013CAA56C|nr:hypothetical protein [Streptomyces sp. SID8499]NED31134.1 hypothetical protein [Streptomyces sp. SID8499]
MSAEAVVHISALMDLFRRACQQQGWTIDEERGLKGWTDVTCSVGHEFRVTALDVVSDPKPFGIDPSMPWCRKCRTASWVTECLAVLESVAKNQDVELTATTERDESGDGHVVFAAKCSKGHHFKVTGAGARNSRGDAIDVLCPGCRKDAALAEGFAKVEVVLSETRSSVVKQYSNGVDIRCRRGHMHSFYLDSWDGRQAVRPDFCKACNKLTRFKEFSEAAKDLGITVVESQWIAASRPHQAVCFAGHEFGLVPNKMKRGCPECPRGMYGGAVPPHDVYYVVSGLDAVTGKDTVKPGISSGSGYNRLRQHAEDGLTVQHLRISGLPVGMARALEGFVLDGLDREGWLATRGVEYFPEAALQDVMDLAGEWFTDQPGMSPRPVIVEGDDVLDVTETPESDAVMDLDVATAVVFDSDEARAVLELTR